MHIAVAFKSNLGYYREQSGWSREQLAQMVGVSRQTIANIEQGRHEPGVLLGLALSTVLKVPPHILFEPVVDIVGQIRRYRFHAAYLNPYVAASPPTLEALAQFLPGVVIRGHAQLPDRQGYLIEVQLDRQSHEQALDEIEQAVARFGLQVIEAYVIEVATATAETALAGGASGGAIGATSKNPTAALAGALIGLAVGAAVGSQVERIVAAYAVRRPPPGQPWELVPVPLRQQENAQGQPG